MSKARPRHPARRTMIVETIMSYRQEHPTPTWRRLCEDHAVRAASLRQIPCTSITSGMLACMTKHRHNTQPGRSFFDLSRVRRAHLVKRPWQRLPGFQTTRAIPSSPSGLENSEYSERNNGEGDGLGLQQTHTDWSPCSSPVVCSPQNGDSDSLVNSNLESSVTQVGFLAGF